MSLDIFFFLGSFGKNQKEKHRFAFGGKPFFEAEFEGEQRENCQFEEIF